MTKTVSPKRQQREWDYAQLDPYATWFIRCTVGRVVEHPLYRQLQLRLVLFLQLNSNL